MRTSSSVANSSIKSSKANDIVDRLVNIGYSEDKANYLYKKYKNQDRLNALIEYIDTKEGIVSSIETIPLRDM